MTSSADQGSPREECLFDFLYLDRSRLASYLAQLFDDGNHIHTKKTRAVGSQSSKSASGSIPAVLKMDVGGADTTQETIERQFDASWSAPLNLLRELNERGFIAPFSSSAALGQLVLFKGNIQILDLRILQKMYLPIMELESLKAPAHTEAQRKAKKALDAQNQAFVKIAENLPHIIQLRAFNDDAQLWATLNPEALTINASDVAFKYGPSIPGEWAVLALLDARPSSGDDLRLPPGLGQMEVAMLTMAIHLKGSLGRNDSDYGITPLAIYREVPGVSQA